jgi:hypothetical protein
MNTEINKKIEEVKKEIEYWKNLIEKIGKKWDYSFESEALAKAKGYLKGLEEARDIYEKELKEKIDKLIKEKEEYLKDLKNSRGRFFNEEKNDFFDYPDTAKPYLKFKTQIETLRQVRNIIDEETKQAEKRFIEKVSSISLEEFDNFITKLKSELNCSLPSNFDCDETALKIVDTLVSELKREKEMRE